MDWLPAEALVERSFLDAMDAVIRTWSLDWSTDGPVRLISNPAGRRRGSAGEPRTPGLTLRIDWGEAAALTLAGWALGKKLDRTPLTDSDRALVLSVAEAAVQDLARRVETALGIDSGESQSAATMSHFEIATAHGGTLLVFTLPVEQLARARKRHLPPPPASTSPLVPLQRALASQPVDYWVWLGEAALTTRDVQRIEVGDVLLLEQGTGNPVDLRLPGSADSGLRGILDQDGTHFALRLRD